MDEQPFDPLVAARSQMDQMIAGMPELARGIWAFYKAMTDVGFRPDQAMELTVEWYRGVCQMAART